MTFEEYFVNYADEFTADEDLKCEVMEQYRRMRAREIANEIRALQNPPKDFLDGLLGTFDLRPPEWRMKEFFPKRGRLLWVAHRKTGKTSLALAMAQALIDGSGDEFFGGGFLGRFFTEAIDGNVGFLNYELAPETFDGWARRFGIDERRLYINHLRGMPNPFATARDMDRLVDRLVEYRVKVLVIDPVVRAFTGNNINDTTQMATWTSAVDELAVRAGVDEVVLTNHSGWDKERGRNSTVLEDWVDVIVNVVTGAGEDAHKRFLSATGRDVDIAEDELHLDTERQVFTLTGTGGRYGDDIERLVPIVEAILKATPEGMNGTELERAIKDRGDQFRNKGDPGKAAARSPNVVTMNPTKANEKRWGHRTNVDDVDTQNRVMDGRYDSEKRS